MHNTVFRSQLFRFQICICVLEVIFMNETKCPFNVQWGLCFLRDMDEVCRHLMWRWWIGKEEIHRPVIHFPVSRHYTGLFNSIKVISLSLELGPFTVLRVIDLLWLSVCVLMQASRYSSILSHMNAMYVYWAHFSLQRNNNVLCKLL